MSTAENDVAEWGRANRHDRATYQPIGTTYHHEDDVPDLADVTDKEQP